MQGSNGRRDFLYYATASAAAIGVGGAIAGLTGALSPSADQRYRNTTRVDFSALQEGQQITLLHLGAPVFLRHRTQTEIEEARSTRLDELKDQKNRAGLHLGMPTSVEALDENRSIDPEGRYVLFTGLCTHMGCVPIGDGMGDFNGWFCPCHSAHFDTSGRTRKGPAPYNLYIPPYEWDGGTILTLLDPSDTQPLDEDTLDRLIYG